VPLGLGFELANARAQLLVLLPKLRNLMLGRLSGLLGLHSIKSGLLGGSLGLLGLLGLLRLLRLQSLSGLLVLRLQSVQLGLQSVYISLQSSLSSLLSCLGFFGLLGGLLDQEGLRGSLCSHLVSFFFLDLLGFLLLFSAFGEVVKRGIALWHWGPVCEVDDEYV
jgi:hypothetical protein